MEADESLMALEQYLTFTIAMMIYVVTPGPGVMAVIARALADGMAATIPHILGIVVGNMIYLLASIYGLAWIAQQMGQTFLIIKLLGGAYLVYLGIRLWRSSGEITTLRNRRPKTILATFFTGLIITASNPKAILFYLAILPAILDLAAINLHTLLPVMVINSLVLMVIVGGYSAIASKVRRLFTNTTAMKKLNKGAGSIMITAGIGIATS
jgi:threonine/homoserine/homoserine lactone efflux protein